MVVERRRRKKGREKGRESGVQEKAHDDKKREIDWGKIKKERERTNGKEK